MFSGSGDNSIKLWDVATGKNTNTFKGHTRAVISIALSPDGKTLASGSGDKTIKLWDVASGKNTATFNGHTDQVWAVALIPDGKTLASGSRDKTIKLWDVASGKNTVTLKGHTGMVVTVAFSPDGKTIASGSGDPEDTTIILWDVATGINTATFDGHSDIIGSVVFSPNGKTLASGTGDNTIKLWDIATGENIRPLMDTPWMSVPGIQPRWKNLGLGKLGYDDQIVGRGDGCGQVIVRIKPKSSPKVVHYCQYPGNIGATGGQHYFLATPAKARTYNTTATALQQRHNAAFLGSGPSSRQGSAGSSPVFGTFL